jgi:hypothetical protein
MKDLQSQLKRARQEAYQIGKATGAGEAFQRGIESGYAKGVQEASEQASLNMAIIIGAMMRTQQITEFQISDETAASLSGSEVEAFRDADNEVSVIRFKPAKSATHDWWDTSSGDKLDENGNRKDADTTPDPVVSPEAIEGGPE